MKTIIHIGQHKTGTTSIQHYLQNKRNDLADEGLYVPEVLVGFQNPSHFLLNVYALDEHRESTAKIMLRESVDEAFFSTLASRLQEDIRHHYRMAAAQNCREIIWSNEGLYLLNSLQEYTKLRQLFESFSDEVVCVCCFRDRDEYRESFKIQLEGLGLSLSDDPDSYRYLEDDSWLFDYERKKDLLGQVFDKVLTLDYDPKDMVLTFMKSLGYETGDKTDTLRLNTTRHSHKSRET